MLARRDRPAKHRIRWRNRAKRSGLARVRRLGPLAQDDRRARRSATHCIWSSNRHGHYDRSDRPARLRHRHGKSWRPRAGPTSQGSPPSRPRSVQKSAPAGQPGLWAENSSAAGASQNPSGRELTITGVGSRDRQRCRFLPHRRNWRGVALASRRLASGRIPLLHHVF